MSRGGSYGGGQSSLGYLFGSDEQQSPPPPSKPITPPYGIDSLDTVTEKPPGTRNSAEKEKAAVSNNYHRAEGQNSGNFVTVSFSYLHISLLIYVHMFYLGI